MAKIPEFKCIIGNIIYTACGNQITQDFIIQEILYWNIFGYYTEIVDTIISNNIYN